MENILEVGKLSELRDETLSVISSLINNKISPEQVDEWVLSLNGKYGKNFIGKLGDIDLKLSDLIDALGLATTPNENGELLYGESDYKNWLDEYSNKSS